MQSKANQAREKIAKEGWLAQQEEMLQEERYSMLSERVKELNEQRTLSLIEESGNSKKLETKTKRTVQRLNRTPRIRKKSKAYIQRAKKRKIGQQRRRMRQQDKNKKNDEQRRIKSVYKANLGIVGGGDNTIYGIWIKPHFITVDYPRLNQNDTPTVKIGNKRYRSKTNSLWNNVGKKTIIPLLQAPSNKQIEKQSSSKLDCSAISSLYLFGKIDRNIYSQISNDKKFAFWSFRPNLNKDNIENIVCLKPNLQRMKVQKATIQADLGELTSFVSNITRNIFLGNTTSTNSTTQPEAGHFIQQTSKDAHIKFPQLKSLKLQCQSKENVFAEKIQQQQFFWLNQRKNIGVINELLEYPVQQEMYKGKYDTDNALRKFSFLDGIKQSKDSFLGNFVRRAYQNMVFVASWSKKRHLFAANFIKEESKDGNFRFSYQTVLCECGCKKEGQHLHGQNMKKKALDQPLLFVIASLDAIIHLEDHLILHNDIQFRNFIHYKGDFLLGDFDLCCFVKDANEIKTKNQIEQELNILNLGLIDRNKLVTRHLQQNQQQINIFFMHTEDQLDSNERSDETLGRLRQSMSKSHQKQFKGLLEELFSDQCNISEDHMEEINKMLLMFDHKQISPVKAYMRIMKWAQEKRECQSLENL